jgi:hypothetical protein
VSTATKPDVLRASWQARSELGQVWLFDPSGESVELPRAIRRLSWSPVTAASSWDEALAMARAMTACTSVGRGTGNERHWRERAGALLAPLLYSANLSGRPIAEVLRWVLRHDLGPAGVTLEDHDATVANDVLVGIAKTDTRERSSIFSATAGVLAAYNADSVRKAAASPNFDPDGFAASSETIYITAPEHKQALCAPLVVGLVEQIRHATYRRAAQEPAGPPLLFCLDEVANIAPIHDLPALVSEAGGQRLHVMLACRTYRKRASAGETAPPTASSRCFRPSSSSAGSPTAAPWRRSRSRSANTTGGWSPTRSGAVARTGLFLRPAPALRASPTTPPVSARFRRGTSRVCPAATGCCCAGRTGACCG